MEDEILEISRQKLFDTLSKAFSALCDEAMAFIDTDDKNKFIDSIEEIIDDLNHNILEGSVREIPKPEQTDDRIEVDWS